MKRRVVFVLGQVCGAEVSELFAGAAR